MDTLARKIVASLVQLQGSAIASIDTETKVVLTGGKKNPFQGRVTKVAEGSNVMFFTNTNKNAYNAMVQRRLVAEGKNPANFQLGPRPWGERIPETPFIKHNQKLYVEVVFLRPPSSVRYFVDGVETDKALIPGLPVSQEGAQGGLDDKVVLRTFMLENVRRLRMGDKSVL